MLKERLFQLSGPCRQVSSKHLVFMVDEIGENKGALSNGTGNNGTDTYRTLLFRAPAQTSRVFRCVCQCPKAIKLQFKQEIGMVERLDGRGSVGRYLFGAGA
jgi:hypothetical protein